MLRKPSTLACVLSIAFVVAGCGFSSSVSESISFDAQSPEAIVIVGTSVDKDRVVPEKEDGRGRPYSLVTHWQQYDPASMRLITGQPTAKTLRDQTLSDDREYYEPKVHVLKVTPGDYALVGASIGNRITTFLPLKDSSITIDRNTLVPLASGIEMEGEVTEEHNFLISLRPGQMVYVGHFNFRHLGKGNFTILDTDYWQDAAAARAALSAYPGITAEMVTVNLSLPTEQAAR